MHRELMTRHHEKPRISRGSVRTAAIVFAVGFSVQGLLGQSFFQAGLSRFAGTDTSNQSGDGGPAYYGALLAPAGIARDNAGNLYVAESARIRKIDTDGVITTIAGTGDAGSTGDGGPATSAQLYYPAGLALDSKGNLYFSQDQVTIRKVAADGTISTFAGNGVNGFNGDGIPALSAQMSPAGLAVDAVDQVYFADANNHRVRVIRGDGKVYTVAGTGAPGFSGEGGPAAQAQLMGPSDLAFDGAGNLYVADSQRAVKIDTHGTLVRVAGNPAAPAGPVSEDNVPATQTSFNSAYAVAADASGDLFISTPRIRKITPDGTIHAFAGKSDDLTLSFTEACGDAAQATVFAVGMKVDASGNVYFANARGNRVQEATPAGKISTIAGAGPNLFTGDGGPKESATFASPTAIVFDRSGNLYVADTNNNRIRVIDTSGTVRTVAGDGGPTYGQDPACVPDKVDYLANPQGVAVDARGTIYVADTGKNRIRKIAPDGTESTIAGTGTAGFGGDGGSATAAMLNRPVGVTVDAAGEVFIADSGNHRVRKIDAQGVVTTVSTRGASGSMVFDAGGDLFISAGNEVDKLSPDGALAPVAGTGEYTFAAAPGFVSPIEEIGNAAAVALSGSGDIYVADGAKGVVQRTSRNCAISADDGKVLRAPRGLAFDGQGNLYASDSVRGIIWRVTPTPPPANEAPTPHFGRTGIRSAAPSNLVYLVGQPPAPPIEAPIAPGELLRVRGACIGPFDTVFARFDAGGQLATSAGGTQILMNGTASPLISVSAGEIVMVAPYELDGQSSAGVKLTYSGVSTERSITVLPANPAIFTANEQTTGPALAANEDWSLNSDRNPAKKGSIVVFYATGLGQTKPPGTDGQVVTPADLPRPKLPVLVTIGSVNAEVLYAGDAPGFVGLTQLNVRVPAGVIGGGAQPVTLEVGNFPLNQGMVTISVHGVPASLDQ